MTPEVKLQVQELTETVKLKYKTCRENAGLTQNEACYHLDIDYVETLSRYENGHRPIPDKVIYDMARVYRNKRLVSWHLRRIHPELAEYIPYPDEVNNIYEAALNLEFSGDTVHETERQVKENLRDGALSEDEKIRFKEQEVPKIRRAIEELTAILMFAEKI